MKIAPVQGDPGHPFTLVDSGIGRLIDGSVAVFRLNGSEVAVPVGAHHPYNTAQGRIPSIIAGGTYAVSVRLPDGTEFDVGSFLVKAPATVPEPSISPTSGVIGSEFTITDPLGRLALADVVVFSLEGQSPTDGKIVAVTVAADGTTATGNVPATLVRGDYSVTAHPESPLNVPLFNALVFTVT